jgi:hypothetical protein
VEKYDERNVWNGRVIRRDRNVWKKERDWISVDTRVVHNINRLRRQAVDTRGAEH